MGSWEGVGTHAKKIGNAFHKLREHALHLFPQLGISSHLESMELLGGILVTMSSFATRPTHTHRCTHNPTSSLPYPPLPYPNPSSGPHSNTPTTFIILLVCLVPIKEAPLKASIHDLTKCGCLSKIWSWSWPMELEYPLCRESHGTHLPFPSPPFPFHYIGKVSYIHFRLQKAYTTWWILWCK